MKRKIIVLTNYLDKKFENPKCELNYSTPFELLVAVILSAQCTDKRVNQVTSTLFKEYNTPEQFANLSSEELERKIHSCGFYKNKAKSIILASKKIVEDFNGEVPQTPEELMSLAGVGKKTANVVYSVAYGGDAIAVDTHVFRVSNRLGIVRAKTPEETERQLQSVFPKEVWSKIHYQLVLFGRYHCTARSPKCSECELSGECDYFVTKYSNKTINI